MSGYGSNYAEGFAFEAGINKGVHMKSFDYNPDYEIPGYYKGEALTVVFEKSGSEIEINLQPIDEDSIQPRQIGDKMQTKEEAVDKAYRDFNSMMKSLATAFDHLKEEDKRNWDEVYGKASSFKNAVEIAKNYLPKDFSKYEGKLIVGRNKKGYLTVPNAIWITGRIFVVKGSDKELVLKTKDPNDGNPKGYLVLNSPTPETSDEGVSETPEADTEW